MDYINSTQKQNLIEENKKYRIRNEFLEREYILQKKQILFFERQNTDLKNKNIRLMEILRNRDRKPVRREREEQILIGGHVFFKSDFHQTRIFDTNRKKYEFCENYLFRTCNYQSNCRYAHPIDKKFALKIFNEEILSKKLTDIFTESQHYDFFFHESKTEESLLPMPIENSQNIQLESLIPDPKQKNQKEMNPDKNQTEEEELIFGSNDEDELVTDEEEDLIFAPNDGDE